MTVQITADKVKQGRLCLNLRDDGLLPEMEK